ncbi:MAG: Lrp/AsnC family transcriptional regulator [Candidatus Bathyarchaeia archaeon]
MKEIEIRLVCELIRNSRKSDRELAKAIGVSQPTISRIRTRLEREGVIEYGGSANLRKLGFEIIAITFGNKKREQRPDTKVAKGKVFTAKNPNMIFVSTGMGLSSDMVAVSVHKTYSDYAEYLQEIRAEWAESMAVTGSFLIALNSDNVLRPLSMRYIADCLEREIRARTQSPVTRRISGDNNSSRSKQI